MSHAPHTAAHQNAPLAIPDAPAVWASTQKTYILTPDGEMLRPPKHKAQQILHKKPVIACHMPYTARRLGARDLYGYDVLELFAFVHPGRFCVPTPAGVSRALNLPVPESAEDFPLAVMDAVSALLLDLKNDPWMAKANPIAIAAAMGQQGKGWSWTPFIFAALGQVYNPAEFVVSKTALNVYKNLPEWAEDAPPPPPAHHPVTGQESRARLKQLLGENEAAEAREQQVAYATAMTAAFAPAIEEGVPHTLLLEAGTGTGKTLGYIAPASVWAEKNEGSVWMSTYTKNLQRQIGVELCRLYPDPAVREAKTAVRKGRENYLCLLNYEEAAAGAALSIAPGQAVAAGLMARWIAATPDGDLSGASFPGWLSGLLGGQNTSGLADRRGECIFSACEHYHRCFVEKAVRKSKRAQMVIANHAVVMIQTALAGEGEPLPRRYIFDEGHHLFDAADSAFAGHLTAREMRDLRRWILGAEGGTRSRARGLKRRAEDLIAGNKDAENLLQDILHAARALTAEGWTARLKDNAPKGAAEQFVAHIYTQVRARAEGVDGPYSLETQTWPLLDALPDAAAALEKSLRALQKPIREMTAWLRHYRDDNADTLDADTKRRCESVIMGLERRERMTLNAWIAMLETLQKQKEESSSPFVDWMEIERVEGGKTWDIGLYRHWINPMIPFSAAIKPHAHGIAVTSATLRDAGGEDAQAWQAALERTGLPHLNPAPVMEHFSSPFDYAQQTRIFVITDVRKDDLDQVAAAYRELFKAAEGGGLGLFTAITRLKGVYQRMAGAMEECGIPLYAQHVDDMDTGTLVDMFRDDAKACLLGTDAVRDGVDVPGDSLRLIVFDRVPWPRPTILHKARKNTFGGKQYDDMITRLKLKQAYGRLIRRANDKGVFVMIDPMLPTRLCNAFPDGVEVQRVELKKALEDIRAFLK